jgi:hypothetical protein
MFIFTLQTSCALDNTNMLEYKNYDNPSNENESTSLILVDSTLILERCYTPPEKR